MQSGQLAVKDDALGLHRVDLGSPKQIWGVGSLCVPCCGLAPLRGQANCHLRGCCRKTSQFWTGSRFLAPSGTLASGGKRLPLFLWRVHGLSALSSVTMGHSFPFLPWPFPPRTPQKCSFASEVKGAWV